MKLSDTAVVSASAWREAFAERAATFDPELQKYTEAWPPAYVDTASVERALADARRLHRLAPGRVELALHPAVTVEGRCRATLYARDREVALGDVLPALQSAGVEVLDEQPFTVPQPDGRARVYDFTLTDPGGLLGPPTARERLVVAFTAMWEGRAEIDAFNRLVLSAGLDWAEVALVRGYVGQLRQLGLPFDTPFATDVLARHPAFVAAFLDLFHARFRPGDPRAGQADALAARVIAEVDAVATLSEDQLLRGLHDALAATVRSNFHRVAGRSDAAVALKMQPRRMVQAPAPRPWSEIVVFSPRVNGVHLRFGPVARGGLRWSDRADLRTEILDLAKAQDAKNSVIVPVGAKGGFVVRRPPAPTGDAAADRAARQEEGTACYRLFVAALLDVIDDVDPATGAVVTPADVVAHDGTDGYLVVAADKGTAALSDTANAIAAERGFWLGDAFASGGSVGYDHKVMGITARGAYESLRRHFRELGLDPDTDAFTAVGVGDMSGDVFGNGMLLSRHVRLVAAFDHRHIFLDPDPDAATSWAERARLFALPYSSWADYDPTVISEGGGVHPRSAKRVPVTPPVRRALGLPDSTDRLTPPELISAILCAPVDLLWNGGIGTYVKAATESHADVGDRHNDELRVDGAQVRARVVVEGGNLGLTQRGRIEYARTGGRLNTDAVDNAAGVACSDREVNIKIALAAAVADGSLDLADRPVRLEAMTGDVAALVLAQSRTQNDLLGVLRFATVEMGEVHGRVLARLEESVGLDRELLGLPSAAELSARRAAGTGLTSPELSVLVAQVKNELTAQLRESDVVDDDACTSRFLGYFPAGIGVGPDLLRTHPLRRDVTATVLAGEIVDRAGPTYVHRLAEDTAVGPDDAARAYLVAHDLFGLHGLWNRVDDERMPALASDLLFRESTRVLDRAARWLLLERPQPLDPSAEIAGHGPLMARLGPLVPGWLHPADRENLRERCAAALTAGAPDVLVREVNLLLDRFCLLDVIEISCLTGAEPEQVGELYFALKNRYDINAMLQDVSALDRTRRWGSRARLALREDLYAALRRLCTAVLLSTDPADGAQGRIAAWETTNQARLNRARRTLAEIAGADSGALDVMSVAVRQIHNLAAERTPSVA